MLTSKRCFFNFSILICFNFCAYFTQAHNGTITLAYPIENIKIDGNLSDWGGVKKNIIALTPSAIKPRNAEDCSAYFQIGYNEKDQALYLAFEVNDEDIVKDTSRRVAWNTQDAIEIYLDILHIADGSAVASYLYSETFKHINNSIWDPIGKLASWDIVQVASKQIDHKTFYEWKILIGNSIAPGRSIGFDVQVFDKDQDGFGLNSWGKGDYKFRTANSLGDIILMKENDSVCKISGEIHWERELKDKFSTSIIFNSVSSPSLWISSVIDSLGQYSAGIPKGKYSITFGDRYISLKDKIYTITPTTLPNININTDEPHKIPSIKVTVTEAPDLIPSKGVLTTFSNQSPAIIDQFIATYQKYYKIPGVSLALIKDGHVIYHKTYGVKNVITKAPVDGNTLFEAASITKPVFAYAVQRLAERGIIDLDKPLYEYLPYKDIEYDDRYKLITGRHVLTHRTGFPNWRWMNADGKLNLKFTPGTEYNYSGEGFQYLQAVIEKITGKKVEEVLQQEVIDPLNLFHTYFSKNDTLEKLVCTGHFDFIPSSDGLPENPGMAYSMHTEANVFTKFMLQLLNQKGLSPKTYANMISERSSYNYDEGDEKPKYKVYMGESLEVRDSPFGQAFGHGGNNGDFRCQFEVYKDLNMGYAIFTNSSTSYPLIQKMKYFLVEGKE